jgi:hypothetical protein
MLGRTNTGGGGGGGLNYTVVGGTSAPSNPKENTIWVNTSTEITFHAFQPFTPSNPQEGWVWIKAGTESGVAFNALKKNRIQLYPLSAKQYISGAWVDKTAKSYQGGKWVDWWNGQLYDNGNQYTEVTGGWAAYAYKISTSGSDPTKPTLTVGSNNLKLSFATASSGGYRAGALFTEKAIDVTNYSKLTMTVSSYSNGADGKPGFGLTKNKANSFTSAASTTIDSTGTKTVDISKLSGTYYVYLEMSGVNKNQTVIVAFTKVLLT